jgi:hypothetical protein
MNVPDCGGTRIEFRVCIVVDRDPSDTLGTPGLAAVGVRINAANELTVAQPNTQNSFNFFGDDNTFPGMITSKAVLTVQPDSNGNFSFQLRPSWNLDANFDMTVTIGTTASKIDGLLGNRQDSGFDYVFQTNDDLVAAYALNFTGSWKQPTPGNADLQFQYDTESGTSTFDLPDGLGVDSATNMLVYRANKNNHSTSIGLIGTLNIGSDFNVTYELEQQDQAGVKSTTFQIQANLVKSSVGSATLDLSFQKTGGTTLVSISGTYSGEIGDNTKLTVGFNYQRREQGGTVTTKVAFQGEVKTKNDDFVWSISDTAGDLNISAHVTLTVGTTCVQGALNFQTSQGQVAVTAMFSVTTGCTPAA